MNNRNMEISRAAELVGIGSKTLFRELRARNILTDRNYPLPYYLEHTYFRVETRDWEHPVTGRRMQYHITTVLPLGMCLISQIAQDIRNGRHEPTAPHSEPNSQPAHTGSEATSTGSSAAGMAATHSHACSPAVRAA